MRRADRLFEIIQILRRRKLARARDLAEKLEVSERTVYRDIAALMASGVPIEGEAGVGYILRGGYDLPPIMFDEEEIEALVLGVRIVESWADPKLAEAAGKVIAKVEAVVPERLRRHMAQTALLAPRDHFAEPLSVDLTELRSAIRAMRKVEFNYRDRAEAATRRRVRPLALAFYGPVWLLAAWCELRQDFRAFRLDRMTRLAVLDQVFPAEPGKTMTDYLAADRARDPRPSASPA